jgi:hypothetical protein
MLIPDFPNGLLGRPQAFAATAWFFMLRRRVPALRDKATLPSHGTCPRIERMVSGSKPRAIDNIASIFA